MRMRVPNNVRSAIRSHVRCSESGSSDFRDRGERFVVNYLRIIPLVKNATHWKLKK